MKSLFYPSIASNKLVIFFLAAILLIGISSKAQQWTIQFPNAPPASSDASLDQNDDPTHGIIFGTKFRVTRPGNLVAIRYYKGDNVGGTHEGWIWNSKRGRDTFALPDTQPCTRTLIPANYPDPPGWCGPGPNGQLNLTAAVFVDPGPGVGGWQQAALPASIHITPADTFIVSIWSSNGDYAIEPTGNTWQGGTDYGGTPIAANPIRVLAVTNDPGGYPPGNGVFLIGTPGDVNAGDNTNRFPSMSNFAPNYWVDIVFEADPLLPVTLSDFKATTASSNIVLSWKTESEQNNRGFGIERSNNGTDWYDLFFVPGAGQSTITRNYGYTDKGLAPGIYYYRLKQKDFDGNVKTSSIVSAAISGKGIVSLHQNNPNPASGMTFIRFDLPKAQKVKLSLFDMTGREVKVLTNKLGEAGSHQVSVDAATLSRQLYWIKLQTESGVLTKKMLVQ